MDHKFQNQNCMVLRLDHNSIRTIYTIYSVNIIYYCSDHKLIIAIKKHSNNE